MRSLRLLNTVALLLLLGALHGQSFRLIVRNASDSVVLRWAPLSAENWLMLNQRGCLVERVRLGIETAHGELERLTPDTLRPMPLEVLKRRFPSDHPTAPIAAQALYGASFTPSPIVGNPGTIIDGANELELRYAMSMLIADTDAPVAEAMGLRFVDRTVEKTGQYLYRVIAFMADRSDTVVIGVDRSQAMEAVPAGPEAQALEMEGRVELSWPRTPWQEIFTAYQIDRSQEDGPWVALTQRPFLPTSNIGQEQDGLIRFTDSTIINYVPYRYRVRGITPFGEYSVAGPERSAMGRDRTAPPSPVMGQVSDEQGRLVVHWEQVATDDLAGFRVEKAITANGAFIPLHASLLPPAVRSFPDTSSFLIGENHYRVVALDTAGNSSISLGGYGVLADSIAPLPPSDLRGRIDTNGVVTVEWTPGHEKDLFGFRVFFANAADHEFHNLTPTPIQQTIFHDTIPLRTLTKHIYYKVVSVDRNFNHSDHSSMLELEKPDIVEPVSPVMADYTVTDSVVHIRFMPSTSDDVATHKIWRRLGNDGPWEPKAEMSGLKGRVAWLDRDIHGPAFYAYAIQAVDSAGNASERTPPLLIRVSAPKPEQAVSNVVAMIAEDGRIRVDWSAEQEHVQHFVVYRSRDGAAPASIGHVGPGERRFTDDRLPGKGHYAYSVKAVHRDGSVTLPVAAVRPVEVR